MSYQKYICITCLYFSTILYSEETTHNVENITEEITRSPSPIFYHYINPISQTSTQYPYSVSNGGTGVTSLTPYAVITGGATPTSAIEQVSNIGTVGQFLASNGTAAFPSWQYVSGSGIHLITGDSGGPLSGANINFKGGTTGLLFSGLGTTEALIGTVPVTHGGTNTNTLTTHGILIGNTTSTIGTIPIGTNGQILLGSTGADPAFITPSVGTGLNLTSNATTLDYALTAPVTVSLGGTGITSVTPYAVLAGDTTSTNPIQQVSGTGTTGQVLTSNDAGNLPSWQNTNLTGAIKTITGNTGGPLSGSNINFSGGLTGLSFNGSGTTQTLQFAGITANGGDVNLATDAIASTINIGTGAGSKITTLGSITSTSTTTVQSGSGDVSLTSASGNIGISTTNGTITANSGTGTVGISTDATTNSLNLGTGAGVKTTTLGSTNSTSATTIQSGTGALNITATNGPLTINSGTGALNISNDAAATTVNVGTGAGAKTVTLGSTNTTSTTQLQSGSGGVKLGTVAEGTLVTSSSSVISTVTGTAGGGQALISGATGVSPSFGTLSVSSGGTGLSSLTAYAILAGGTTTTDAMQQVSGVGTTGQVLLSNGASALPTWQNTNLTGAIQTITGNDGIHLSGSNINFSGGSTGLSFTGSGTTETLSFTGITANGGDVNLATDATTSTLNIGTGAGAKTTTLGSTNSTSATTIQSGSGALNLTSATGNIGISTTNGTITANSGTGTVGISTDATANSLNLGTGAGVKTTTLGSNNSTSATTVQSGTGALNITATNGALTINSGTGDLNISNNAAATTVNVGTGAGAKTVRLGSTDSTSTTQLQAGSGGVKLGSSAAGAVITNSSSVLSSVNGTAGQAFVTAGSSPSFGTLGVAGGGTGRSSLTAYRILTGGTTSTGALQQVASNGTSGQVLMSNDTGALPSWGNLLPGYIDAGNNFLYAGKTGTLLSNPQHCVLISSNSSTPFSTISPTATDNTMFGAQTANKLTGGTNNIGIGVQPLNNLTTGNRNIGIGFNSLQSLTITNDNTGIGNNSLYGELTSQNVAVGHLASDNNSQTNRTALGYNAELPFSANSVVIGTSLSTSAYMFGIDGVTSTGGIAVLVNSSGTLGTTTSSRRFKENIESIDSKIAAKLLDLNIVQFNYIDDETKELNYGVIAEDVLPIFPEMIIYSTKPNDKTPSEEDPLTVFMNPNLTNEEIEKLMNNQTNTTNTTPSPEENDAELEISSVQYQKLLPLVIKQLQSMQQDIDDIKETVKIL